MEELKVLYAKGWIHPVEGDDKPFASKLLVKSRENAEKMVIDYLKKRKSEILDDFSILTEEEFKESERRDEEYLNKLEAEVKAIRNEK